MSISGARKHLAEKKQNTSLASRMGGNEIKMEIEEETVERYWGSETLLSGRTSEGRWFLLSE